MPATEAHAAPEQKLLLTVMEAFKRYGFESPRQLHRLIRIGTIPPGPVVHLGRRVLLHSALLEAWLAAGGTGSPPDRPDALPQPEVADGHQ